MWILRNSKGDTYYLLTGKQHTVGRKDTDLLLLNDQSISRKHAILEVEHKSESWGNPQKLPTVKLIEAGAKYGTSVISHGGEKQLLPANSTYMLEDGDQIQFGLQWNLWKLEYKPLVVSLSTLSSEEKKSVKAVISKLGGHVVDTWSPACTHLTMCSITLTVKAVCALADGKPIVMPEMWNRYLTAAEGNLPLPSYEEFIPPLGESTIKQNEVSFKVNERRKTLFKGKKFVFFTRAHCNQHQCLVLAAGGTPVCLEDAKISKKELVSSDVIVMQIADRSSQLSQASSLYGDYINYLQASSRRLIPVSEIGLAILHCSMDKYCNPSFSFASTMLKCHTGTVIQDSSEPVLAMDTQEAEALRGKMKASSSNPSERKKIIPASGTSEKECEISTPGAQAAENEEQQNTISPDASPFATKQPPVAETCARLEKRPELSLLKNKILPLAVPSKRPSEEKLPSYNVKRRHLSTKEEHDTEDLFTFVSDRDEVRDDADLFSFAEDLVKEAEDSEADVKGKAQKRKASEDYSPHIVSVKKPNIDFDPKPGPSKEKEKRNVEAIEDFMSFQPKTEAKPEEDEPLTIGVNKTIVILKDMVIRKGECSSVDSVKEDTKVENFKKFKKVRLPYQRSAPHIIGGKDLIVYETQINPYSKVREENEVGNDEVDEEEDDVWAFQPSQNVNKIRVA